MSEQHRYFPDWTLRSLVNGPEIEAEDNSYLAGGYAEEFGYRARISYSPDVSQLDGDVPESFRARRCPACPVHPGYPLRAQPVLSELEIKSNEYAGATVERDGALAGRFGRGGLAQRSGTFIIVSNRAHTPSRVGALPRATIVSIRLTAALVALRWAFRRR
jgi:hypothetical protein